MNDIRQLCSVDTLRFSVTQPFNFRYSVWKPSHFATGLERHSQEISWRTFRVGEHVCGVIMHMADPDTLQADVFGENGWTEADRERLGARIIHSYGLNEDLSAFVAHAERVPEMRESLTALAGMRQSCPENLFEIAVISLLLQNATVARTTQMMTNLLDHYGQIAEFGGVTLKAFFTPAEIAGIDESVFRERDRLGYRAKYIGRFAEFFTTHDPDKVDHASKAELMTEFQRIKGVGPYTAAIIAGSVVRDPSALGLDVWNRKILAQRFLHADDAEASVVQAKMTELFPGYEGLAGLYVIEDVYRKRAVVPLIENDADCPGSRGGEGPPVAS
ncbi:DNA-3-methyladenine glycosylase family protein [Nocardia africana]